MKKIACILSAGFVFALFAPFAAALTPPPGWTPSTCAVNVEYSYNPQTQFACQCPSGSTYVHRGSGGTYPYTETRFICQSAAQIPACQQAVPGMSYLTIASQCRCPNGTIVWSNNGYSDQCTWTTPTIQSCKPMQPDQAYTMDAALCKCPNGTIVWGNGNGYTNQCVWNTTVTCWDGSVAPNQASCPAYKYCPGDNATKRHLSYTCPVQTKTCWNGSVVPVTQSCPTPVCHSEQHWNGYQCVNIYPRYPTNYCNDWTQWVWGTCMDIYYDYYDYYYDYYSNNWDSWYRW